MEKKIIIGMSGGVDSSVAAILLQEEGFDVYGITLKLLNSDINGRCCNIEDTLASKRLCDKLGIPHYTLNYIKDFKENVIDYFVNEYENLRTPNPCIECNKYLKFGKMYEAAKDLNVEYIATGHYANIEYSEKYGRYVIRKANNIEKDQTYFLYNIPKEILPFVRFPLGKYSSKDEIRKIASSKGFTELANKPDSEDVCFIPNGDYREFLEKEAGFIPKVGNIVDKDGNILGKHEGLYKYTIGQRRGLGISNENRLYVIGYNKGRNELIVGEESDLYQSEMIVKDVNLLLFDEIKEPIKVNVKTRYSKREAPATISQIDENNIKVIFDNPEPRITSGQSAVFYIDDILVGGGKIV